ncbi:nuclear receptor-binding protein-like [Styela clava]
MEEKVGETKSEESEHESEEDESEILEESPCGRWLKRSEEVSQRNVPGIDRAYLAMDSEEGVEVVWNEVQFSERKSFKQQEEKIKAVFDNLMRIDHANIVKFHRYWIDYSKEHQKTRVVFITEYMSSGSVKEFLNKTKDIQKYKRTKSWKRWCTQILSALTYLHNCVPPVIHGNMTCDTIFIQHNGLVKIGSVAPDAIRNHVKTYHEIKRNMHYYAPEYGAAQGITPAVDIYSFGICALEMAVPRSQLHYRESKSVTASDIESAIDVLEDPHQQDFIRLCLQQDPLTRPSARSLLLHPLLFEVHSLKLLAAHAFVKNQRILPEYKRKEQDKDVVLAQTISTKPKPVMVRLKDVPVFDVDKFLEDVMNGVYPLTSFALPQPPWVPPSSAPAQTKGQVAEGHAPTEQADEIAPETRKIVHAQGTLMPMEKFYGLILQLRFEDKMNRHLNCEMNQDESAETLVTELVEHRLIKEADKSLIKQLLEDGLRGIKTNKSTVHFSTGHLVGAEDISVQITPTLQPVSQTPLVDTNSYIFYSNLLPKTQPQVNGGINTLIQQIPPHTLPIFPTATQTVLSSAQTLPAVSPASQTLLLGQVVPATVQSTSHQQPHLSLGQHSLTLAQQVMPQQQTAVLTQQPLQIQYMQYLQQHQSASSLNLLQQPPNLLQTSAATQVQPQSQAILQAHLLQQHLQSQQALYAQQQPIIVQQPSNQAAPPMPRHVHFQSVASHVQPHNLTQQAAIPVNLLPHVLQQQQPPVISQTLMNPPLNATQIQSQQHVRMQGKQNFIGDIQRSTTFFNLPPQHQQAQPQSNNSNNSFYSRNINRVDDVGSIALAAVLPHAATHPSMVSANTAVHDIDVTGTSPSPPTSFQVVGVDSVTNKAS